jgi:peroxiredoxin
MTAAFAEPGDHLRRGESLPVFEATDQNGVVHTSEDLRGPNGLVLVVFRSADW